MPSATKRADASPTLEAPASGAPVHEWIGALRRFLDQFEVALGTPASNNGHKRSGRHTGLTQAIGDILEKSGPMTAPQIRRELECRGIPFTQNSLSVYLTRHFRRLGMPPQSLWTLNLDRPTKSRSRQRIPKETQEA